MKFIIEDIFSLSMSGYAKKAYEKILEVDSVPPEQIFYSQEVYEKYLYNKGWHLIRSGNYVEGFRLLENGRIHRSYGSPFLKTEKPLWNPETIDPVGKTILVSMEGGFGDEFIHARFIKYLKPLGFSKVIMKTMPQSVRLLACIEGVDQIISDEEWDKGFDDFDVWFPSFSLFNILKLDKEDISGKPYIKPVAKSVLVHAEYLQRQEENKPKKPKVGIRWSGNPEFEHQQLRLFPKEYMFELAKLFPGIDFYSLQRDTDDEVPQPIIDLKFHIPSWDDTSGVIANLDLVVSSCTSVAHLSAGMGIPTAVVVPITPYYVWAEGSADEPGGKCSSTSRWYDSVVLCRQRKRDSWRDAFIDVVKLISEKFSMQPNGVMPDFDKKITRLNMGCGFVKMPNAINTDVCLLFKPDVTIDFSKKRWKEFKDNTFDEIYAHYSLEYIKGNFIDIVKEMARISKPGATWEIISHHHKSDKFYTDPEIVRPITKDTFALFDQQQTYTYARENNLTPLGMIHGIDIQLVSAGYLEDDFIAQKYASGEMSDQDIYNMHTFNTNTVKAVRINVKVRK